MSPDRRRRQNPVMGGTAESLGECSSAPVFCAAHSRLGRMYIAARLSLPCANNNSKQQQQTTAACHSGMPQRHAIAPSRQAVRRTSAPKRRSTSAPKRRSTLSHPLPNTCHLFGFAPTLRRPDNRWPAGPPGRHASDAAARPAGAGRSRVRAAAARLPGQGMVIRPYSCNPHGESLLQL